MKLSLENALRFENFVRSENFETTMENLSRNLAKICILPTEYITDEKAEHTTSGLASVGVYVRGKFSRNLKVCRPSEHLCTPVRTASRRP